ncbi:cutinase family protein [Actinomycetospora aeridis]|uniref:Cutinase family protein n=1 Tax=Actinomycetospora aeridis TaxID=3129231 RepID=A0ABU8N2E0_9PSEU
MTVRAVRRALLAVVLLLGAGLAVAPGAVASTRACPQASLFAVPGTGETSEAADPARSIGLLAGLTDPLARRWGDALEVRYVPYPATVDRPFYFTSERRGAERLARDAGEVAARCPDTSILLVGFSQGGDVVSDVVHRAANGTVALPAGRIAGAIMLGSPRRDPQAPNLVATPGRGVLGPRPTRELAVYDGRVYEVCAPGDPICATENLDVRVFREGWASGAHRSYPDVRAEPGGLPLFTVLERAVDAVVARDTISSMTAASG